MKRLSATFAGVVKEKRAALVCFLTCGYPDPDMSKELLCALPSYGADIVELGIPFSDASADGETIRQASYRALQQGINMERVLTIAKSFRKENPTTPLILMGYYNPVFFYGTKNFVAEIDAIGVDGIILVDLPPEEEEEVTQHLSGTDVFLIHLITPTTNQKRLGRISQSGGGFLYYVSITGVTGTRSPQLKQVKEHLQELNPSLPVAIGFGIKEPQQARVFGELAQAVVVGSSLIQTIQKAKDKEAIKPQLREQVNNYASALRNGD